MIMYKISSSISRQNSFCLEDGQSTLTETLSSTNQLFSEPPLLTKRVLCGVTANLKLLKNNCKYQVVSKSKTIVFFLGTSNDEVEASVSVNMKTIEIEEPPKKPVYIPSKPVQMEKPPKKPAYIPSKPVKIKEEPRQPVYIPSKPVPMSGLADYIKKNKSSRSGFQHDYEVQCHSSSFLLL